MGRFPFRRQGALPRHQVCGGMGRPPPRSSLHAKFPRPHAGADTGCGYFSCLKTKRAGRARLQHKGTGGTHARQRRAAPLKIMRPSHQNKIARDLWQAAHGSMPPCACCQPRVRNKGGSLRRGASAQRRPASFCLRPRMPAYPKIAGPAPPDCGGFAVRQTMNFKKDQILHIP